jgi:hypothetical protein
MRPALTWLLTFLAAIISIGLLWFVLVAPNLH